MGGLIVQILLDHGYGAVGVAIDSAPLRACAAYRWRRPGPSSPY